MDLEPNVRYLITIERKEKTGHQNLWDTLSEFPGEKKDALYESKKIFPRYSIRTGIAESK